MAAANTGVWWILLMRLRRKKNLDTRIERCAHLLVTQPEAFRGRWLEQFGFDALHVELGCGKGRFTVETAKAQPRVLIVALEKLFDAMIIALERAGTENNGNTRFVNALADNITDYFAQGEVSRIYINFCDPWPTNRRAKRRLTCRRFLELYREILCPGGELHFKTDNLPLFEFSLREFEYSGFIPFDIAYDLHKDGPVGIMTDYELKFYNQGIPIYSARSRPQISCAEVL